MRVALKKNIATGEFWGILLAQDVAMGEKDETSAGGKYCVGGHNWEVKDHLVYFCIAISAHAKESHIWTLREIIEHGKDGLGVVITGKVIAWAVVK